MKIKIECCRFDDGIAINVNSEHKTIFSENTNNEHEMFNRVCEIESDLWEKYYHDGLEDVSIRFLDFQDDNLF